MSSPNYSTPIPGASVYGGAALMAKTAYEKSLARINQQRGTTIRNAGFTSQIDPVTGMVKGLAVDQTNKYGDFQQLNRQQAQQDESARWSAQSRGLGTKGGLAAQVRSDARYDFGAQDAKLGMNLGASLQGYNDQQVNAGQDRDAAMYQAELAAAQQAIQNRDFNPADYSGLPVPDYGSDGSDDSGSGAAVVTPPTAATRPPTKASVKSGKKRTPILNQRQLELAAAKAPPKAAPKAAPKATPRAWGPTPQPILPKKKKR